MKEFVFLLCLTNICFCSDDYYYRKYNIEEYGKDEYHDAIDQPCSKEDLHCIREVLSKIYKCNPLHKQRSGNYYIDDVLLTLPLGNTSFVWRNAEVKGFNNFKIKELFVNKKTGGFVFEVLFESVVVKSPKSSLFFYLRGKEPEITEDYIYVDYRDFSLTLNIFYDHESKKVRRHIYTYLNESELPLVLGPKFTPRNPEAYKSFNIFLSLLSINLRELFVNQGPVFFDYFLNTAICDLNIKSYEY